jgi:hypothetical protein
MHPKHAAHATIIDTLRALMAFHSSMLTEGYENELERRSAGTLETGLLLKIYEKFGSVLKWGAHKNLFYRPHVGGSVDFPEPLG